MNYPLINIKFAFGLNEYKKIYFRNLLTFLKETKNSWKLTLFTQLNSATVYLSNWRPPSEIKVIHGNEKENSGPSLLSQP